jgi:threonine/homoserine/homoserine lactone efflux protein
MSSQLISLIIFGIAASFSPGPNNIVTSYSAYNFGFKKTIPQFYLQNLKIYKLLLRF